MPRTKGAKGFKIKDLFETSKKLKHRSEGKRPRWNLLLVDTGSTLERLGRMTSRAFVRKNWSMYEYAQLVQALRNCADVIEAGIKAQEQEDYEKAIELLKE